MLSVNSFTALKFLTVQKLQKFFLNQKKKIYISNTKENFKVFFVDLKNPTTYTHDFFSPTHCIYSTRASWVLTKHLFALAFSVSGLL